MGSGDGLRFGLRFLVFFFGIAASCHASASEAIPRPFQTEALPKYAVVGMIVTRFVTILNLYFKFHVQPESGHSKRSIGMSGEVRLELSAVIMNSAQSRGLPMRKEQPEKVRMTQLHFR